MDLAALIPSLLGGIWIGVAVTVMLLLNGRVTGISGILSSSLAKPSADSFWRLSFIAGLLSGGFVMYQLRPEFFTNTSGVGLEEAIFAGLLVGYGTVMGSGCTSGHGVCGLSRFSMRSLVATITFLSFGFLTVLVARYLRGELF